MDFPILLVPTNFNMSVSIIIYTLAYMAERLPQENQTCFLNFLLSILMKCAQSSQEDSRSDISADCQVGSIFCSNTTGLPGHGAEHIKIHCKN